MAALEINDVMKWDRPQDIITCGSEDEVNLWSFHRLYPTAVLNFGDGMNIDNGYLFFHSNKLHKNRLGTMDFLGEDWPNFSI